MSDPNAPKIPDNDGVPPAPEATPAAPVDPTPPDVPTTPYGAPTTTPPASEAPTYGSEQPAYAPPAPEQPAYGAPAYGTPGYAAPAYSPATPGAPKTLSLISMIAGIVGILGSPVVFFPIIGGIMGLFIPAAAIVLGFLGKKREGVAAKGFWLTGIITGFVGVGIAVLSIVAWIALFALSGASGDFNSGGFDY